MKSDTDLDLVFKNAIGKKVTLNIDSLTEVIGELNCNIAVLRGETPKKM